MPVKRHDTISKKPSRKQIRKWFEVRSSRIQGFGAFAVRPIPKGTRIIEYTGERISHEEADARYDDAAMERHHTFLFTVDEKTVIDAMRKGNDSRYINHSCEPNCETVVEEGRIFIDAIRDISPGEELFFDYAYERDGSEDPEAEKRYACRCGAKTCRKTILAPPSEETDASGQKPLPLTGSGGPAFM